MRRSKDDKRRVDEPAPRTLAERYPMIAAPGKPRPARQMGAYPPDLPYTPLNNLGMIACAFDRVGRSRDPVTGSMSSLRSPHYIREEAPGTHSDPAPGEWYISRFSGGQPVVVDSSGCTQAYHSPQAAEMACVAVNAVPKLIEHIHELEQVVRYLLDERQGLFSPTPDMLQRIIERYASPVFVQTHGGEYRPAVDVIGGQAAQSDPNVLHASIHSAGYRITFHGPMENRPDA